MLSVLYKCNTKISCYSTYLVILNYNNNVINFWNYILTKTKICTFQASFFINGFNQFSERSNTLRRNHTEALNPLSILSEDEQFFKETGIILFCLDIEYY